MEIMNDVIDLLGWIDFTTSSKTENKSPNLPYEYQSTESYWHVGLDKPISGLK